MNASYRILTDADHHAAQLRIWAAQVRDRSQGPIKDTAVSLCACLDALKTTQKLQRRR